MKTTKLRKKRSTQLLRECWSFLTKLMTCQNLQNKLLNITELFIWYLLASFKKMSLAKHGELYLILASTCFSPLAKTFWRVFDKNRFPHCHGYNILQTSIKIGYRSIKKWVILMTCYSHRSQALVSGKKKYT
jgi:hypothetical protein